MELFNNIIPFSSPPVSLPFWLKGTGELLLPKGKFITGQKDRSFLKQGGLFLLLRRGLAWAVDDQDIFSLEPGCVFYWENRSRFHLISSSQFELEATYIILNHQDGLELFHPIFQSSSFCFPLGLSNDASTHLVSIYRSHKDGFSGDAFQVSLKAYGFLMELLRGLNSRGATGQPWITAALDIARTQGGRLIPELLARQLGVDQALLSEEWIDKTGTTLEEFQQHIFLREQIFSHSGNNNKKLALILDQLNL